MGKCREINVKITAPGHHSWCSYFFILDMYFITDKLKYHNKKLYNYLFFILQMACVIHPIGQKTHQVLGLNKTITIIPIRVDVSIRL